MSDIMIFDSLDTIQGYEGAQPGLNKRHYQEVLAKGLGINFEEFMEDVSFETQLWLTAYAIRNGVLTPKQIPGSEEILEYVRNEGIEPIIVTADVPQAAELTTKSFVESGLVERVYAINDIGSKKDPETWKKNSRKIFS